MAGHNKWSKVKRLKAVTDSRRGKVFSRLSRDITLAAKSGGGDPEANARLRTLVLKAREAHLAGATVLRGPMGFGKSSRLHTAKILRLSEDLPVLIEIVDREDRINAFLPELDKLVEDGLVTLEKVRIITYRATPKTGKKK